MPSSNVFREIYYDILFYNSIILYTDYTIHFTTTKGKDFTSWISWSICYFLISLSTRKRNSNVEYLFNASDSSKTYRLCVILSGIDRADSGGIMTEGMFAGTLLPSLYLFDLSLHTLHQPPFSTPHHDMPCPLAYSSLGSFTYDIKIMTLHISQCCENYMK